MWRVLLLRVGRVVGLGTRDGAGRGGGGGEVCLAGGVGSGCVHCFSLSMASVLRVHGESILRLFSSYCLIQRYATLRYVSNDRIQHPSILRIHQSEQLTPPSAFLTSPPHDFSHRPCYSSLCVCIFQLVKPKTCQDSCIQLRYQLTKRDALGFCTPGEYLLIITPCSVCL